MNTERAFAAQGLTIGVILPEPDRPGPGAIRLLNVLSEDARFEPVFVAEGAPSARRGGIMEFWLALEGRLLGQRGSLPLLTSAARAVPRSAVSPCDVIIDLCGLDAPGQLSHFTRFGIWQLDISRNGAGYRPSLEGADVSPVSLWIHPPETHSGGALPRLAARAEFDVKFLASRNEDLLREKSVQLVIAALRQLALTGTLPSAADLQGQRNQVQASHRARLFYPVRVAGTLLRRVQTRLKARRGGRPGAFSLRLARGDALSFDPASSREIAVPGNRYWADPFLFRHDGALYLFFEDYDYTTRRGHIGVGRIDGDTFTEIGPAMRAPHHLSYPFVFARDGEIYMMPETHQTGRIEMHRATRFPTEWELHATALEGTGAVDSALVEHEGRWWLFTNLANDRHGDFGSELHLFMVDGPDLANPVPHPLNPVVIGSDRARGGGRIFAQDGALYRASQDNTHGTYGYGLNIMRIDVLTPTAYAETRMRHLGPDFAPGHIGLHHVDALDGTVVFDARRV